MTRYLLASQVQYLPTSLCTPELPLLLMRSLYSLSANEDNESNSASAVVTLHHLHNNVKRLLS